MKINKLLFGLITVTGLGIGAVQVFAGSPFKCTELLGRATEKSVSLRICSNTNMQAYCEYGEDSLKYSMQTTPIDLTPGAPVTIVMYGLSGDKKYYYRLKYKEQGGGDFLNRPAHYFSTQKSKGKPFSFAIEADPHLDTNSIPASYSLTLANISAQNPDFLMDLGDTFMSEKLPNKTNAAIEGRHLLLRSYFESVCSSIPLYLVIGNHEGEIGWELDGTSKNLAVTASNFRNMYFTNPIPDGFYTGNSKSEEFVGVRAGYYAWEWGDALMVVLDPYWYTMKKPGWGWTLGVDQYNWFKKTLTESKAKFKFVFCHNLLGGLGTDARGGVEGAHLYEWGGMDTNMTYSFDKNRPGWGKPIHQLMVENGVSAFFHGHDHFYGKQIKDGVIYQEVPQPSNRNITNLQAKQYGYVDGLFIPGRGYLKVSINDSIAKIEYIKTFLANEEKGTDKNGMVADSYIIQAKGANNVNDTVNNNDISISVSPNPTNDWIEIKARANSSANALIEIFDVQGNLIKAFNQNSESGEISINWDCRDNSNNRIQSGSYLCRLSADNDVKTIKFNFIK